jgi:hypothetical protein
LREATSSPALAARAAQLGVEARAEKGVERAVTAITRFARRATLVAIALLLPCLSWAQSG